MYYTQFLFTGVLEGTEKGNRALMPAQMTHHLPTHLRAAGMEDQRDAMRSFRVGGAASHIMDATAMDVFMNTWGGSPPPSHADTHSRGNGVGGSGGSEAFSRNGVHRGGRPLAARRSCTFMYRVPTGQLMPNPLEAKVELWVR